MKRTIIAIILIIGMIFLVSCENQDELPGDNGEKDERLIVRWIADDGEET